MAKEHQGASLPKELLRRIDYIVKETDLGYTSRADFVKEAVRQKLDEVERKLLELEKLKKETKGKIKRIIRQIILLHPLTCQLRHLQRLL